MAEVLVQIAAVIPGRDGRHYVPRVCGREAADGLWDGWIEFDPEEGGSVLRTRSESRQPNRDDLQYWAGGLTVTLERALNTELPDLRPKIVSAKPTYDGPAPASAKQAKS
jgi:hypothetical protein